VDAALDLDGELKGAAFAYLEDVRARSGGLVSRAELEAFEFGGRHVPLIARQRGIWKPTWLECALSIVTTYTPPNQPPPYEDEIGEDGYPRYKWRGTDPYAYDTQSRMGLVDVRSPA
jgi:putative restriction endonuclease